MSKYMWGQFRYYQLLLKAIRPSSKSLRSKRLAVRIHKYLVIVTEVSVAFFVQFN